MESMVNYSFWKNKKVLVTGHSGFKGTWLTLWLIKMGAKVEAISLSNDNIVNQPVINFKGDLVKEHFVDIREEEALKDIINNSDAEIVFHLAAQALVTSSYKEPKKTFTSNVNGTLNLLDAIRSSDTIKNIIVVTTDKVYLNNDSPEIYFSEKDALGGNDPYSASKAMTELLCTSYRESYFRKKSIKIVTARAGNVIGGGDWSEDRLVPDFFKTIREKKNFIVRYPDAIRPWQHVLESIKGYLLYAEYLSNCGDDYVSTLNFGPNKDNTFTVSELIDGLSSFSENGAVNKNIVEPKNKESINLLLNSDKAKLLLNWSPAMDMLTTLRTTSEWYHSSFKNIDMKIFTLKQLSDYEINYCNTKRDN